MASTRIRYIFNGNRSSEVATFTDHNMGHVTVGQMMDAIEMAHPSRSKNGRTHDGPKRVLFHGDTEYVDMNEMISSLDEIIVRIRPTVLLSPLIGATPCPAAVHHVQAAPPSAPDEGVVDHDDDCAMGVGDGVVDDEQERQIPMEEQDVVNGHGFEGQGRMLDEEMRRIAQMSAVQPVDRPKAVFLCNYCHGPGHKERNCPIRVVHRAAQPSSREHRRPAVVPAVGAMSRVLREMGMIPCDDPSVAQERSAAHRRVDDRVARGEMPCLARYPKAFMSTLCLSKAAFQLVRNQADGQMVTCV